MKFKACIVLPVKAIKNLFEMGRSILVALDGENPNSTGINATINHSFHHANNVSTGSGTNIKNIQPLFTAD